MKKLLIVLLVCGASALSACSTSNNRSNDTTENNKESGQFTTYEDALFKARTQKKLIMLDVYTDWCVWCKKMDKEVYTDSRVKTELEKYFGAVKLNAEAPAVHTFRGQAQSEQNIASQLNIEAYPTLVFMTGDEKPIKIVPGYVAAPEFALVLRYIGSGAYQNADYETWKKTQS